MDNNNNYGINGFDSFQKENEINGAATENENKEYTAVSESVSSLEAEVHTDALQPEPFMQNTPESEAASFDETGPLTGDARSDMLESDCKTEEHVHSSYGSEENPVLPVETSYTAPAATSYGQTNRNQTAGYQTGYTQSNANGSGYSPGYGFMPSGNYGSYRQNNQVPVPPAQVHQPAAISHVIPAEPQRAPYTQYQKPTPPPKKKKDGKKFSFKTLIACALVCAVVGGVAGGGAFALGQNLTGSNDNGTSSSSNGSTANSTQNISIDTTVESVVEAVAQKSGPSVVGIRTTAAAYSFLGGNSESSGEGSGIIYKEDGYIITNYHVIQQAAEQSGQKNSKIEVYLPSDTETAIEATIVGYNISYDLAVIKIDKKGLPAIELGNSDDLNVGQYAIAIGNPGGLSFMGSVSYGIISGLNRNINGDSKSKDYQMELIQTDAAINPGNSGGALVNAKGQLIGVNSVKLVAEGFEGMGFAIPVNKVVEICDKIISKENEPTPYIGIEISTKYDSQTLQMLGYPAGAVVQSVVSGSPAEKAGITRGDIITELSGTTVTSYSTMTGALEQCTPGETAKAKVFRGGQYYDVNIAVEANN